MALTQGHGRGKGKDPKKQLRKGKKRGKIAGSRVTNLDYQTIEDRIFTARGEELEDEFELEEDLDEIRARRTIPDGDEEDEEKWEPGEEVYESDDWDRRERTVPAEDFWERREQMGFVASAEKGWIPRPDIFVDSEEILGGPKLYVQLTDRGTLLSRTPGSHDQAQPERLMALRNRQKRLLDVAHYIAEYQKDFFLQRGPLKPLTQVQIATALWPQENLSNKTSDVSRLLSGKWLRTPWGDTLPLESLVPSEPDVILEHIKAILREHDRLEVRDGQVVVEKVIPADSGKGTSIVSELRKRLGKTASLSPENVKHIMREARIPALSRNRRVAYETGTAFWRDSP